MAEELSKAYFIQVIEDLIPWIEDRKEYFTDLDSAIGDGDHGINLSIGFREVASHLDEWKADNVAGLYKNVGKALLDKVGGSAGPLYGSFFMKFGVPVKKKGPDEGVTGDEFVEMMDKAISVIQKRGKSTTGEKTMNDTLMPALDALKAAHAAGDDIKTAMGKAVEAGKAGLESTRDMIATKGRAMRLGERAVGHLDPGAASTAEMLEIFYKDMPDA